MPVKHQRNRGPGPVLLISLCNDWEKCLRGLPGADPDRLARAQSVGRWHEGIHRKTLPLLDMLVRKAKRLNQFERLTTVSQQVERTGNGVDSRHSPGDQNFCDLGSGERFGQGGCQYLTAGNSLDSAFSIPTSLLGFVVEASIFHRQGSTASKLFG